MQIPLRTVLPEGVYFGLAYNDIEGYAALFARCCDLLTKCLNEALVWNGRHGISTFVVNFMLPQQNFTGRLLPKNDLRNFECFIARLNAFLYDELARRKNVYVLDVDRISAGFGRRHLQDDVLWAFNHGAALGDNDFGRDASRLHPPTRKPVTLFKVDSWKYLVA